MSMQGKSPKPKGKDSSRFKHGFSFRNKNGTRNPIYIAWVNMRQRCNNPKKWDYKFYGGRGIYVCNEWKEFSNFFADMGNSYFDFKKQHGKATLDRIDVNKEYSPQNCRWATSREQMNNRSCNIWITYKNVTKPINFWVKQLNIPKTIIYDRICNRRWDIDRAFTQPFVSKFNINK